MTTRSLTLESTQILKSHDRFSPDKEFRVFTDPDTFFIVHTRNIMYNVCITYCSTNVCNTLHRKIKGFLVYISDIILFVVRTLFV